MSFRPGSRFPAPVIALPKVERAGDFPAPEVLGRLREGSWQRSGRGVYVPAASAASPREAALARLAGVHHRLGGDHVFSHESAALLWGLTLWRMPDVTHVEQPHVPGGRRDGATRRHRRDLPPTAITEICGLRVTTLEQTVLDCARALRPLAGLVVADSGLRAGASRDVLAELLRASAGRRGIPRARQVLELADDGSESAWETAARFVVLRAGLPVPATQVALPTRLGTRWVDLGWEEWGTYLEYDGRPKYADPEELVREKRRHDALIETGVHVLHATKEDVLAETALIHRVTAALPRGVPRVRRPYLGSGALAAEG